MLSNSSFKLLSLLRSSSLSLNAIRAMSQTYSFEALKVSEPSEFVKHVEINRPDKRNAMNKAFWREMVECFEALAEDSSCRSIVFSGAGSTFTAGLDLMEAGAELMAREEGEDVGRRALRMRKIIKGYQRSFTVIEECPKPVIVAVSGACVGGGVDLVTACDIRYASKDAWFQIKEVDLGLAADVGTLQRLPRVIGSDSLARELAYTARRFPADEALSCGLISRLFEDKAAAVEGALATARAIAERSPVAVQLTKRSLVYSRDHSVPESLENIAVWNQCMLLSEDLIKASMAAMQKQKAKFAKL